MSNSPMTTHFDYCGTCPVFQYEDMYGDGCCAIRRALTHCSAACRYLTDDWKLDTPEAIRILHYEQKWRRANKSLPMLPPRLVGLAIDYAIRTLRRLNKADRPDN